MKPYLPDPPLGAGGVRNQVAVRQPLPQAPSTAPSATGLARAYASADPRFNAKQRDRAGLSRGRGQMAQAGIGAAQNFSQGIAEVYNAQLQRQVGNADAMLQMQRGQEEYGQALADLQSQDAYAEQMARLQRQGVLYGLLGDMS